MEYINIKPNSTVLVLNNSYQPLHFTDWKRAVLLLFKNKAHYVSEQVIRLVNYVRIPFMGNFQPTSTLIYKRDDHTCQYCGSTKNLTIDHIVPRSKGGQNTWSNLVTCCYSCNIRKGDKNLKDTDLVLRKKPSAPLSKILLSIEKSSNTSWKEYLYA